MPTQLDFLTSFLLGVAPALALLWFSLRRFDRPRMEFTLFDDRRIFGHLAVGMIFGVFASVLNLLLPRGDFGQSVVALAAGFAFEEVFKSVVLNRRGYRGRFDTTFTGLALGAGAASTAAAATIYWFVTPSLYLPEIFATFALFSASLALINVDTGAVIGFGASRGQTWKPLAEALAIRGAHGAFLSTFLLGAPLPWSLIAVSTSIGFALLVYHHVYTQLLPASLPEDLQRKARRGRRRVQTVRE